ncbi:MAG TPA: MBL fold metallo-hydrolase [Anaerolineae bacterium]|nr:MBL fold metallo-hydrolase [Anaerolineae bacterium]
MRVRVWGVRGGIPSPSPHTVGLGGNTACIDILTSDKQTIILDAGTGIRSLGNTLLQENPNRILATILISHTHWDHIQGFPFFAPVIGENNRNNRFVIIGQGHVDRDLQKVLAGQIREPYLPFSFDELTADLHIKHCHDNETMIIGDATTVHTATLDHPGGVLGFRIENNGASLAYCTDCTHPQDHLNPNVLRIAQNADILFHDAQFLNLEERQQFAHYGHSSWLEAAEVARTANVKCLALFHYAPDATDTIMMDILHQARDIFPNTVLAREGMSFTLPFPDNFLPS